MKRLFISVSGGFLIVGFLTASALAWDYEGHRLVNQLALASLPTNFPAFVHAPATAERIAFLAGEPDRWRNVAREELPLSNCSGPDHYIDVEQLADYGLKPDLLPIMRGDFIADLAVVRKAHPEKFTEFNNPRNVDHTRELVGLLPWAIAENYGKLKSCFAYLRAFEEDGTPEELTNAQANVVYVMGVMGHYVGDAAQPLHTTIHHHGWKADKIPNPNNYSTNYGFHSKIDGFLRSSGANEKELASRLKPAHLVTINGRPAKPEEIFQAAMIFVMEQNKLVEPLYQLEKEGKLPGEGSPGAPEGKAFLEGQLIKAAEFLGDIWYTAYEQAPPDTFLKRELTHRKHVSENTDSKTRTP
jgi:hypothetical protein